MEFLNALTPWQWAVAALVPLGIVLLYFLKLRREPLVVPSTLLWLRAREELYVNRPFKWLRYHLLLLLQLLLVALALLACARPAVQGPGEANAVSSF
jgi:hypothetical protein